LIRRSFTLLETMIGVGILSVICLGLVQAVLVSLRVAEEASRQSDITEGAVKALEQVLRLPYEEIVEMNGRRFDIRVNNKILGEAQVRVSADLNGDGLITYAPPANENPQLAVKVTILFEQQPVVERIVTRFGRVIR